MVINQEVALLHQQLKMVCHIFDGDFLYLATIKRERPIKGNSSFEKLDSRTFLYQSWSEAKDFPRFCRQHAVNNNNSLV